MHRESPGSPLDEQGCFCLLTALTGSPTAARESKRTRLVPYPSSPMVDPIRPLDQQEQHHLREPSPLVLMPQTPSAPPPPPPPSSASTPLRSQIPPVPPHRSRATKALPVRSRPRLTQPKEPEQPALPSQPPPRHPRAPAAMKPGKHGLQRTQPPAEGTPSRREEFNAIMGGGAGNESTPGDSEPESGLGKELFEEAGEWPWSALEAFN